MSDLPEGMPKDLIEDAEELLLNNPIPEEEPEVRGSDEIEDIVRLLRAGSYSNAQIRLATTTVNQQGFAISAGVILATISEWGPIIAAALPLAIKAAEVVKAWFQFFKNDGEDIEDKVAYLQSKINAFNEVADEFKLVSDRFTQHWKEQRDKERGNG